MTDAPVPAAPSSQSVRILLVEDNDINREIARAVLEAGGYRVDVVADGAEAVTAVQIRDYNIVLMDIQMPGMDGVTATRHIRALNHRAANVPIIAMTASVLPQQVSSFFNAGMNGHVGKPFKRDELYSAVERWALRSTPEADTPQDGAILDRETFDGMLALLGREKTTVLLERLAQQLQQFGENDTDAASHKSIKRNAHEMISAAGLLGFNSLSKLCLEIEHTCEMAGELGPLLKRMIDLRRAVLREIESTKAEIL